MSVKPVTLRCPTCRRRLDPSTLCCSLSHCFHYQNGVLVLLGEETAARLVTFATTVAQMRRGRQLRLLDPALYDSLPCGESLQKNIEWRWRCSEVTVVKTLIQRQFNERRPLTLLDVGAYNGWLSHQLSLDGHAVTAVDYFIDEFDGLGAVQHYSSSWQAIQIDLVDLAPLDTRFDVVIMNHGLHFFPDPLAQVKQLMAKVAPGGLLVLLGLLFYRDPRRRRRQVEQANEEHLARYGQPRLFRPAPGYLDFDDRTALEALGVVLRPADRFRLVNVLSRLLPALPWRGYGFKTDVNSGGWPE